MSAANTLVEIVTTVASEADARKLARGLVEARLAACVSLLPLRSVYRWEGEICDEAEVQLVAKTDFRRASLVEEWIRERHPYDTPAVLRLPILKANADYERWVLDELGESS
jgi:periplasmic divalent cation tolerance protein